MVKSCHILKYFYTLFQTWQLESQVVTICSHVYKPYASVSKLLFQLASNTDLSEVLHFQLTANLQFELLTTLTYPHTICNKKCKQSHTKAKLVTIVEFY